MHVYMSILEPPSFYVMIMSSMHNRIQGSYKTLGAMNTQHPICRDCTGSMEQNNCSIVEMLRIQTTMHHTVSVSWIYIFAIEQLPPSGLDLGL